MQSLSADLPAAVGQLCLSLHDQSNLLPQQRLTSCHHRWWLANKPCMLYSWVGLLESMVSCNHDVGCAIHVNMTDTILCGQAHNCIGTLSAVVI